MAPGPLPREESGLLRKGKTRDKAIDKTNKDCAYARLPFYCRISSSREPRVSMLSHTAHLQQLNTSPAASITAPAPKPPRHRDEQDPEKDAQSHPASMLTLCQAPSTTEVHSC